MGTGFVWGNETHLEMDGEGVYNEMDVRNATEMHIKMLLL